MEGIQRLQRLYTIAQETGVVRNKKEFAQEIGMSYTTLVRTMNGEKYYNPQRSILAAEDMLRDKGIDPSQDVASLQAIMDELKMQRKLLEDIQKLLEKGHI